MLATMEIKVLGKFLCSVSESKCKLLGSRPVFERSWVRFLSGLRIFYLTHAHVMLIKGAQSQYFELFWPHTKLPFMVGNLKIIV